MLLRDKVIFLTGGSTGIGFECARRYGRKVLRSSLSEKQEAVREATLALGSGDSGITCDVSQEGQVEDRFCRCIRHSTFHYH